MEWLEEEILCEEDIIWLEEELSYLNNEEEYL
jgi:hypothetical protein